MKNINIFYGAIFVFNFLTVGAVWAESLNVVTEQYPPYNYEEDGKVKGVGTEVVEEVLRETGIDYTIKVYPWTRALQMAEKEENVLIYCISRTEKREHLYTWVGIIAPISFHIYALKSRSDIPMMKNINEAKDYKLGIVYKDVLDQHFSDQNFTNIIRSHSNEVNIKQLFRGGVDLLPMSEYTVNYLLKKNVFDPNELKKVHELKGLANGDQYMALSNKTDKKLLQKIQVALKK